MSYAFLIKERAMIFFVLFVSLIMPIISSDYNAVVSVAVADLVAQPYSKTLKDTDVLNSYKRLACGDTACERAYQLLFHEIVSVEDQLGIEVKVRVPHIIYYDSKRDCYDNCYWTLASNLMPISDLQNKKIDIGKLPSPISWNRLDLSYCSSNVVTLTMPFNDSETKNIYSAGTRFVINCELDDFWKVWIFDAKGFVMKSALIPKQICKVFENKAIRDRVLDYINLLRKWTKLNEGFIPYVFSGSSFTSLTNVDEFKSREDEQGCAFYWREEFTNRPYSGFDCSCIISRASQMCGLAYFYKDSQTLVRNLEPIQEDDTVQEGDIIWFPGHVMIVSDVRNNMLIESRGYASGFGKTHEIELSKAFTDIETYEQLKEAHLNKHQLKLLARDGSLRYVIEDFKILKFASYSKFFIKNWSEMFNLRL